MKVNIEHSTFTKGLLSKRTYYQVHVKTELTHEESAIIDERSLWGQVLVSRPDRASGGYGSNEPYYMNNLKFEDGDTWDFLNEADARKYAALMEEAIREAKAMLDDLGDEAEDKSFEL